MKLTACVILTLAATISPALSQEKVIVRRSPACIEQEHLIEFYKLSQQNPDMGQVADFLRSHHCIALKSGEHVTIERDDKSGLYYCGRIPGQDRCYWIRRTAFER